MADDKLRRLRDEFEADFKKAGPSEHSYAESWYRYVLTKIDRLLAEDEPTIREDRKVAEQPTDDRDDEVLRMFVENHETFRETSSLQLTEFGVLLRLARRALSSSPSRHVRGDQP